MSEDTSWDVAAYLPRERLDALTEARIHHPGRVLREARRRKRRRRLAPDGRLILAALDHPGRGVNEIRGDALAMGDRWQYLARARRVLDDPDLDGVMATADVIEELLLLSDLERRERGRGFLDGRVLVGSMNRGGLAGTSFELDDSFTAMGAARIAELKLDGGKMMYRLDPQDAASGRTILGCAHAINDLRRHRLAAFLEPLGGARGASGFAPAKDAATLVRQCGIAAALGDSSLHVWLKVPIVDGLERVCRSTTLPLLLLGGPARGSALETLADFARGFAAGARVRGAIVGRNLLFPGAGDPLPLCRALTALAHRGASLDEARRILDEAAPGAPAARPRRRSSR
ncbi:MAG: hypothetical protein AB7O37_05400 [Vicinamibacteria bacterium]